MTWVYRLLVYATLVSSSAVALAAHDRSILLDPHESAVQTAAAVANSDAAKVECVQPRLRYIGGGTSAYHNYRTGNYLGMVVDIFFLAFEVVPGIGQIGKIGKAIGTIAKGGAKAVLRAKTFVWCGLLHIGCFAEGTPILIRAGPVPIEAVRAGQEVRAFDQASEKWVWALVQATHARAYEGVMATIRIRFTDGSEEEITATGNHPFWVESGKDLASRPLATDAGRQDGSFVSPTGGRYVEAQHLTLGDRLLAHEFASATVVGLTIRTVRLTVYNLTVFPNHNFAVGNGGVVVHNIPCPLPRGGRLPTLSISARDFPGIAENIRHAMKAGRPAILTRAGGREARRAAALRGVPKVKKLSRDEYPFACVIQGGSGAWVGHVKLAENTKQGTLISSFFARFRIRIGDRFRVIVVP